jgi:hypothetical protein
MTLLANSIALGEPAGTWLLIFWLIPVAIVVARMIVSLIDSRHYKEALATVSEEDGKGVIRDSIPKRPSRWSLLFLIFLIALAFATAFSSFESLRGEWPRWIKDALFVSLFSGFLVKDAFDQLARLNRVEASPLPASYLRQKRLATVEAVGLDSALVCCAAICWILSLQYSWSLDGTTFAMICWVVWINAGQLFYGQPNLRSA